MEGSNIEVTSSGSHYSHFFSSFDARRRLLTLPRSALLPFPAHIIDLEVAGRGREEGKEDNRKRKGRISVAPTATASYTDKQLG